MLLTSPGPSLTSESEIQTVLIWLAIPSIKEFPGTMKRFTEL